MAKFFVGQRVKVVRTDNPFLKRLVGKECTVITRHEPRFGEDRWVVEPIDHTSDLWEDPIFVESHLAPLVNPDELAWQAFKTQHLTPDPILAKEVA